MATSITLDVSGLTGLASRLAALSGAQLQLAGSEAVNAVAERTEPKLRESIIATVNLSNAYVAERTGIRYAQPGTAQAVATIYAPYRHTPLGRYAPQIMQQAARSPIKRLKGNAPLGIPKGLKPLVVNVEVIRGQRKDIQNPSAFMVAKIKDSDGNPLIFVRRTAERKSKLRALYGPSVYQLFRVARDTHIDEISNDLQLELMAEVDAILDEQDI